MKIAKIVAAEEASSEIVFTPAALLDLLTQVDELSQYDIGLYTSIDGNLQLQIGDSYYDLTSDSPVAEVDASDEVVEAVADANEEAYDNMDVDDSTPIESGPIKELLKTLAVGGLVRLGKKMILD